MPMGGVISPRARPTRQRAWGASTAVGERFEVSPSILLFLVAVYFLGVKPFERYHRTHAPSTAFHARRRRRGLAFPAWPAGGNCISARHQARFQSPLLCLSRRAEAGGESAARYGRGDA